MRAPCTPPRYGGRWRGRPALKQTVWMHTFAGIPCAAPQRRRRQGRSYADTRESRDLKSQGAGEVFPARCWFFREGGVGTGGFRGCTTTAKVQPESPTDLATTRQNLQDFGARVPPAANLRHTPTIQPSVHPLQGGEGADRVPGPAAASPLPAGRWERTWHPRHARYARSDEGLRAPHTPASLITS